MFDATCRSEPVPAPAPRATLPAYVRAAGGVRARFARIARGASHATVAMEVAESAGYRIRFPHSEHGCEAALINTGGGMTGGDHLTVSIDLGEEADALVTSQAAEKIYRSQGPETRVETKLSLGGKSRLFWMPQEAILFSQAHLSRSLSAEMAADATLLAAESTVFGRQAMGESLARAHLRESWRVRRAGRLIFADELRLEGPVEQLLARPALGGGARAMATVLVVAPDAESRLELLRETMSDAASSDGSCECGASAWNGMLVARVLGPDPGAVRALFARMLAHLRGAPLPRVWQC